VPEGGILKGEKQLSIRKEGLIVSPGKVFAHRMERKVDLRKEKHLSEKRGNKKGGLALKCTFIDNRSVGYL